MNKVRIIWKLIEDYFDGDTDKTFLWLTTDNPILGNVCPLSMILCGREDKLLKFIKLQLEENIRE